MLAVSRACAVLICSLFVVAMAAAAPARAADPAALEFFEKSVRPVLVERCLSCHAEKAKGGLRLRRRCGSITRNLAQVASLTRGLTTRTAARRSGCSIGQGAPSWPDPPLDNLVIGSSQAKDGSAGSDAFSHPAAASNRYAAGMTLGLTLLQTEVTRELPIPAWAFGVLAFGILLILLLITWSIGRGRPHS